MRLGNWCPATAIAGLLSGGLFAAWRWGQVVPSSAVADGVCVAVLGVISAALAVFLTASACRNHYRRLLAALAQRLDAVRNDPYSPAQPFHEERDILEPLVEAYCRSLGELGQVRAQLSGLQTERVRLSAQLGQELAPAYLIVGSRHRLVARLGPNLQFLAISVTMQQFLGYPPAQLGGHSFLDIVHHEDVETLQGALQQAMREGEGHDIPFRILIAPNTSLRSATPGDGNRCVRHLHMDVMTCYTEDGMVQHLRCHFLDITDRVLTERELLRRTEEISQANASLRKMNEDLERLKESYRDLYHFAPVLYFSLDASGNFVAFNERMTSTLGYPREALIGKPFARLLTPASRAAYLKDPGALMRPGELETQFVKYDGTVIDVWIGTTTIPDPQGRFVRSRSAARDVTDRNRLANELRAKAVEVGQANAQLRRINQELEEFTHVVSHDLKEPLRTLETFSNFLRQDYGAILGQEGQEYIDYLIQASRRLGALIDDLLTLSRAGRVINTPRPFSWDDTIPIVMVDLLDLIQRKQAVVRVEGQLPAVMGDPQRVAQLLSNLISNGLKYNSSPHPEIVIGAVAASGPLASSGPAHNRAQ
jgi:PAS domain S-box-containing protein